MKILGKYRYYCKDNKLRPFSEIPQAKIDYPMEDMHWINQVSWANLSIYSKKLILLPKERHRLLGSMYRETLGPDVSILWVADPTLCKEVFLQDCRHPRHVVPEAWRLHAKMSGNKRGLFFLDGSEWARWRTTMNRVFIKEFPSTW